MAKIILVLGMHRSGTSALMGLLESTGVYLGPTNPAVREPGTLVSIDTEILELSGGSWDRPPRQPTTWTQRQDKRAARFLKNFEDQAVWGMKDPRLLFTLEFWYPRLLPDAMLLATFRNPVSVALSLNKRNSNRWPVSDALELYTAYNRRLLHYNEKYGFPIVNFDLKASQYLTSIDRAFQQIGYVPERVQDYFNPDERHHTDVDMSHADDASKEVYEMLCKRAIKPNSG